MQPPRTRYAKSGDLSIAYQVWGDGPLDVVLVPGFVSHLDLAWEEPTRVAFLRGLGSFARVICFDKRGTGLSDRPPGVPTLEERMDDIRVVMDAAGSDRAALIGLSEGAPLSLLFTATYPERTTALVLSGGFARGPDRPDFEEEMTLVAELWGSGEVLRAFTPGVDPEWAARAERSSATPSMAVALLRLNTTIDVTAVLGAIRSPTLVLHNRGDPIVPFSRAEELAARIKGARLIARDLDTHAPGDPAAREQMLGDVQEFLTGTRHVPDIDRVLATVMFTDIVSSTEKLAALGDARWRQRLELHTEDTQRLVAQYRGRLVKSTGDGVLATFDGPARAVRCAAALVGRASDAGLPIRAGVHTGEVEPMGNDIGGIAVHIAKRVESAASPGEVWVSQTVHDLVVGSDLVLTPMDTRELRGVPGEWRLYQVARA